MEEASADLGADTWQTLRHITFPMVRTALLAGGLLAFALSFDEIVVTTFTAGAGIETLPQWILNNITQAEPAADRERGGQLRRAAVGLPRVGRPEAHRREHRGRRPLTERVRRRRPAVSGKESAHR